MTKMTSPQKRVGQKKKPAIFYNKLVSLFILLQIIFSF
ncbi:hypothetical protein CU024_0450 [Enterococcus faecium]|nr:hypothetical protein [Enterococcus faecium]MBK4756961.1 hypothetical protein [Enterococcus faecium]MBK4760742.1 hypothetical protein [Enterococcus faecium]MBK4762928.1 hypothetical protein [Enterococcus faecium]MBK4789752.1 hypothetical protein [Enterococcus faecium]